MYDPVGYAFVTSTASRTAQIYLYISPAFGRRREPADTAPAPAQPCGAAAVRTILVGRGDIAAVIKGNEGEITTIHNELGLSAATSGPFRGREVQQEQQQRGVDSANLLLAAGRDAVRMVRRVAAARGCVVVMTGRTDFVRRRRRRQRGRRRQRPRVPGHGDGHGVRAGQRPTISATAAAAAAGDVQARREKRRRPPGRRRLEAVLCKGMLLFEDRRPRGGGRPARCNRGLGNVCAYVHRRAGAARGGRRRRATRRGCRGRGSGNCPARSREM